MQEVRSNLVIHPGLAGMCWDVFLRDSSLTDDVINGACQMFHAGVTCGNPTNVLDVLLQQAQLAGHAGARAKAFFSFQNHMWIQNMLARVKCMSPNTQPSETCDFGFFFVFFGPGIMASMFESAAAFESRAKSCGLSEAEIGVLKTQGVTTLAKLAFAITTPGVNPSEDNLRSLINSADPSSVVVGTVSALRRLMFDAQTLAVQLLKSQVEGGES